MNSIGDFLRDVRQKSGWTQAQIAERRQASRGAQSQLELAKSNPTWATIEQFATAVGARVVLRFELLNGATSELVAGLVAPRLLKDLEGERARWQSGRNFESPIATKIAEAVEPSKWARQMAMRILLTAAVVAHPRDAPSFVDPWEFGQWEDEKGNVGAGGHIYRPSEVGIAEENRIILRGLARAVSRLVDLIADPKYDELVAIWVTDWQIPLLAAYIKEGSPEARSITQQLTALADDQDRTDQLLAELGYSPLGPRGTTRRSDD